MALQSEWYEEWGKRALDLSLVIVAAPLWVPLVGLLAVVVRIALGSPVLFKQERPGIQGKSFTILKFRSMTDARDSDGDLLPDQERLTRTGRFLRSTSLDELPELWNVIRGEMSLVGPRPLLHRYLPYYRAEELCRFDVPPGITGLAQISGRNDLPWDERLSLDIRYVQQSSFLFDMTILVLTFKRVLQRRGVRVVPEATMLDLDRERAPRNG